MLTSDPLTTIAIVGAGFSGCLVATHLLKTADRPLRIELIDRSHDIGNRSSLLYTLGTPRKGDLWETIFQKQVQDFIDLIYLVLKKNKYNLFKLRSPY